MFASYPTVDAAPESTLALQGAVSLPSGGTVSLKCKPGAYDGPDVTSRVVASSIQAIPTADNVIVP